jgi:hypothetical protein
MSSPLRKGASAPWAEEADTAVFHLNYINRGAFRLQRRVGRREQNFSLGSKGAHAGAPLQITARLSRDLTTTPVSIEQEGEQDKNIQEWKIFATT